MATVYGVRLGSYIGHSGDESYNLYQTLADAQKGIDTLLWVFTDTGGFCTGDSLEFEFDIFTDSRHTTAVDLTPSIVLSGPNGDRYPLTKEGVLAKAKFLEEDEEAVVEVAGRRLTRAEFASFARPWVDWSRVPFDPNPDEVEERGSMEGIEDERPFGLHDLLICGPDDVRRVLRCDPAWLTADVLGVAKSIRKTGDVSGLGPLADALDEAGCDNPWFPWHLRLPAGAHARGSWVVGHLLEQATRSAGPKPKSSRRGRGQSARKAKPRPANKARKPR
jgi:hypothetical protein